MTRYFVYTNSKNEDRASVYFIADPRGFVDSGKYSPLTMKYAGVSVEADSPHEAEKIYHFPHEYTGEIFWVDEPSHTSVKRIKFEKDVANLEEYAKITLEKLARLCEEAFKSMTALLLVMDPKLTEAQAYNEMKRRFITRL